MEADFILRIDAGKGLVGVEDVHGLHVLRAGLGLVTLLEGGAGPLTLSGPHFAVSVEVEDVVEAQAGEQLHVALVGVHHAEALRVR